LHSSFQSLLASTDLSVASNDSHSISISYRDGPLVARGVFFLDRTLANDGEGRAGVAVAQGHDKPSPCGCQIVAASTELAGESAPKDGRGRALLRVVCVGESFQLCMHTNESAGGHACYITKKLFVAERSKKKCKKKSDVQILVNAEPRMLDCCTLYSSVRLCCYL
jgi:predicted RNA-binding protein YlxR (DUF448 family)